jgi:hypothetical protein
MLVFIRDRWFQLRERPGADGAGTLEFMYPLSPQIDRYVEMWAIESERDDWQKSATKTLPFAGHETGVYEGVVVANYHPDGPPHSQMLQYEKKVIQKTKP